ncbi:MAG: hypothetical protein HON94_11450, partial [Methylococcales bacterium]|nr:hypothetical protein [Methylococcales bacterium]
LFKSKAGEHSYASPDNATRYFTERLNQLAEFCKQYPKSYHYFDADLIRTTPDLLLKSLQQWLNLSTPLSKTYQSFSQTGLQRAGDTSAMIKQGHIINQPSNYENIFIPPALLQKAEAIHTEVKSLLIKNAIETERMT